MKIRSLMVAGLLLFFVSGCAMVEQFVPDFETEPNGGTGTGSGTVRQDSSEESIPYEIRKLHLG